MELEEIKLKMNQIRESSELWKEFSYSNGDNYLKRYGLAIQLQYDLKNSDYELVRFLMENEILCRTNDSFQGIGDSLTLISYLLSTFNDPSNVILFERAKYANFDTYCGYDSEFIFSSGVKSTCDYLDIIGVTEENKFLYDRKDNLRDFYSEAHITNFLKEMSSVYPSNSQNQSVKSSLDRAITFGNYKESDRLFQKLEEEIKPADNNLLYYYAKLIKNYRKAIFYQQKILDNAMTYGNKASGLHNIADLHCLNSDYKEAYITSLECMKYLKRTNQWKDLGLGRMVAETWYVICLGFLEHKDFNKAAKSFKNAEYMIKRIKKPYLNLLKKAYDCSLKLNKEKHAKKYKGMIDKEQVRINIVFNKKNR